MKKGDFEGRKKYPTTVSDAYTLLLRTSKKIGFKKSYHRFKNIRGRNVNGGYMLVQNSENKDDHKNKGQDRMARKNGITHEKIRCYK